MSMESYLSDLLQRTGAKNVALVVDGYVSTGIRPNNNKNNKNNKNEKKSSRDMSLLSAAPPCQPKRKVSLQRVQGPPTFPSRKLSLDQPQLRSDESSASKKIGRKESSLQGLFGESSDAMIKSQANAKRLPIEESFVLEEDDEEEQKVDDEPSPTLQIYSSIPLMEDTFQSPRSARWSAKQPSKKKKMTSSSSSSKRKNDPPRRMKRISARTNEMSRLTTSSFSW